MLFDFIFMIKIRMNNNSLQNFKAISQNLLIYIPCPFFLNGVEGGACIVKSIPGEGIL